MIEMEPCARQARLASAVVTCCALLELKTVAKHLQCAMHNELTFNYFVAKPGQTTLPKLQPLGF
jgi:hypothetical protein